MDRVPGEARPDVGRLSRAAADPSFLNVLGTNIRVLNPRSAGDLIESWLAGEATGRYVCVTGVHGVVEGLYDAAVQEIHNQADACVPDGMPLSWLGWLRGYREMDRVYGPDLMLQVMERCARLGRTSYLYGGNEGVAEELRAAMEQRFPDLRIVGQRCPPFRPLSSDEERAVVDEINALAPDVVWIGLSTPKQERCMAAFQARGIRAKVMIGVGAAFDFHTGRVRRAPRWMQRVGLEWLFRLCMEPRRLAGRYLRNNPVFLWHIALQLAGIREYPVRLTSPLRG